MKRQLNSFVLFLFTVSIISCNSSLKVTRDYDKSADFTKYKTFGMYPIKVVGAVSQENADRIMNAIRTQMSSRGFVEQANTPDLMVNALTILKDKIANSATSSANDVYSFGSALRPYSYWEGSVTSGYATLNTGDYRDGSLSIEIVNNKTNKMVWQGVGSTDVDKTLPKPEEFINKVVTKIMSKFPPKTGK